MGNSNRKSTVGPSLTGLLDSANVSIIATDPQGIITFVNKTAERWLGYQADDLVGKHSPELFHDAAEIAQRAKELSIIVGHPVESGFSVFTIPVTIDGPEEREWTYIAKDGKRFPVKLSVNAINGTNGRLEGYLGIATDLSGFYHEEYEFRELFNVSVSGILVLDESGKLVEVNDVACRMYGYGRTMFLNLEKGFNFKRFIDLAVRERGFGQAFFGEFDETRADGSLFSAELIGTWVNWRHGRYLMIMVSDISAKKHQEQLNRLNEQRYRNMVEQAVDALFLLDMDANRFIDANANAVRLLGYTREQILKSGADLLFPQDIGNAIPGVGRAFDSFIRAVNGEAVFFEHEFKASNASVIPCETRITRMPSERNIVLRISLLDISERKAWAQSLITMNADLERRVAERTEALRASNQELSQALEHVQRIQEEMVQQEKLAELGALVAGITHEISSPIGNALLAAGSSQEKVGLVRDEFERGVLSRGRLEDFLANQAQSGTIIEINLRRANDMIATFKQLAVDQTSDQRRIFDLHQICQEVCTAFHPQLKRSGIKAVVEVPSSIRMDGYPGALGQVLGNLVQNSIVHGFPEPKNRSAEALINFSVESGTAQEIVLLYRDNGSGMSEEVRRQAFEPFFSTRIGKGGSGLGLHLVLSLVENRLGGSLELESGIGQGVLFRLRLPMVSPIKTD